MNANYEATPEEFTKVLDDSFNQRMQSATKILTLRFKMKELMTVEEWKALSDQMLADSGQYRHSESAPRTGYCVFAVAALSGKGAQISPASVER